MTARCWSGTTPSTGSWTCHFMMAEIWKHRRITVRGLGEDAHYAVPIWRELLGACVGWSAVPVTMFGP